MKTTNVPLVGKCAKWDQEIPPNRIAEFKLLVGQVQSSILSSAATHIATADETRQWHRTLFDQIVPVPYYAGHFRGVDATRPCLAVDVAVAGVPGAPHAQVQKHVNAVFSRATDQIAELELRWAQLTPRERAIDVSLLLADLVGHFIKIHPYVNGNGRTSRLLWRWGLLRFGVSVQCTTHPRPGPPYGNLMAEAMRGDNRPLALYILNHLSIHPPQRA